MDFQGAPDAVSLAPVEGENTYVPDSPNADAGGSTAAGTPAAGTPAAGTPAAGTPAATNQAPPVVQTLSQADANAPLDWEAAEVPDAPATTTPEGAAPTAEGAPATVETTPGDLLPAGPEVDWAGRAQQEGLPYQVTNQQEYLLARHAHQFLDDNWNAENPTVKSWQGYSGARVAGNEVAQVEAYVAKMYPRLIQQAQREQVLLELIDGDGALTDRGKLALSEAEQDYQQEMTAAFQAVSQQWGQQQQQLQGFTAAFEGALETLALEDGTKLSAGDRARLTGYLLSGEDGGRLAIQRLMREPGGATKAAEELAWRHPDLRARRLEAIKDAAGKAAVAAYIERERKPRG